MRAISSMATRGVLAALSSAASAAGVEGYELESMGGVDAAKRVAAGEPVDLVFLDRVALAQLAADGHVDAATLVPVVVSDVAVAVTDIAVTSAEAPSGAAFADAEALRAALLDADRIGYSTGPSGKRLVALIESWGLMDQLDSRLVQARPGVPVARLLADGEVDLGFQQRSELVGEPGVRILGGMPAGAEIITEFCGAVATAAADADAAAATLRFCASPDAAPTIEAHNFATP